MGGCVRNPTADRTPLPYCPAVMLWRKRFETEGLESLWEVATGRGRKPTYGTETIQSIIDATLQSKTRGMTHWSCRLMAETQQVSKSTVSNIWPSHNLKPHRTKTFKLSRDAKFLEKLTDVVGLYLNPRNRPWCSAWTKRVRFRHWIARSRVCPSRRADAGR